MFTRPTRKYIVKFGIYVLCCLNFHQPCYQNVLATQFNLRVYNRVEYFAEISHSSQFETECFYSYHNITLEY